MKKYIVKVKRLNEFIYNYKIVFRGNEIYNLSRGFPNYEVIMNNYEVSFSY